MNYKVILSESREKISTTCMLLMLLNFKKIMRQSNFTSIAHYLKINSDYIYTKIITIQTKNKHKYLINGP